MHNMNKKLYKTVCCVLSAAVSLAVTSIPAMASSDTSGESLSIKNEGSFGAVDIDFVSRDYTDSGNVVPGDMCLCGGYIVNKAEAAWIRIKADIKADESGEFLTLKDIKTDDEDWICAGEYFYCLSPLESGGEDEFIAYFNIPEELSSEYAGYEFEILFTAEAVQYENFEPDFSAEDPWLGLAAESMDAGDYHAASYGSGNFKVIYKGGAEALVSAGENFFSNWDALMPGDILSDSFTIYNRSDKSVKLYFSMNSGSDKEGLTDKLKLTIMNGDHTIFNSTMNNNIEKEVLLGEYKPGDSSEFKYKLDIPEELNNAYALKTLNSTWTFKAVNSANSESTSGTAAAETSSKESTSVKTGDSTSLMPAASGMLALILLLNVFRRLRKEAEQ